MRLDKMGKELNIKLMEDRILENDQFIARSKRKIAIARAKVECIKKHGVVLVKPKFSYEDTEDYQKILQDIGVISNEEVADELEKEIRLLEHDNKEIKERIEKIKNEKEENITG